MADIRTLLKSERAARKISHPLATYSTTGTLTCLVCNIQVKSESLWNGHLRSVQHATRLQIKRDGVSERSPAAPPSVINQDGDVEPEETALEIVRSKSVIQEVRSKKRKVEEEDNEDTVRKRSKAGGVPEGFFDDAIAQETEPTISAANRGLESKLPSRPATPLKSPPLPVPSAKLPAVDEDEWAAFEADIAAAEAVPAALLAEEAIINAPAMSAAELAVTSREEETARRRKQQEAEMEGDKEDAVRKMEDEFAEMEALEERIKSLKEKREALRLKGDAKSTFASSLPPPTVLPRLINGQGEAGEDDDEEEDEDEDEDYDDDDWAGFRLNT